LVPVPRLTSPFIVALRERGSTAIHDKRPRSGRVSDQKTGPEITFLTAVSQKQQHLRLFLMDPVQLSRHYYYHCLAQASRRALSHSSTRVLHQQRNKLSSIQRWWQSLAADGTLLAAAVVRVGRIVQGGDHGHRPRRTTFLPCFPFPCSRTRKVAIFSFL
jgi:hypothetical protein